MGKRYWIGGGVAALLVISGVASGGGFDDTAGPKTDGSASVSTSAATSVIASPTATDEPSSVEPVEPVSYSHDDVVKELNAKGYALINDSDTNDGLKETCDGISNRPLDGPKVQADRQSWVDALTKWKKAEAKVFVDDLFQACIDTGHSRKWVKPAPTYTFNQEQAIGSAKEYLNYSAFSRQGLIDQLSSDFGEGYAVTDATFAVDHIEVDWNQQAVKSAKEYLQSQHFSRSGLIDQLSSAYGGQFTYDQALYGVNHTGLR